MQTEHNKHTALAKGLFGVGPPAHVPQDNVDDEDQYEHVGQGVGPDVPVAHGMSIQRQRRCESAAVS